MKVLFVDQLSHVEGKNAYYLARKINHLGDDLTVELFFSITDKNDYIHDEKTKIIFEFGDAYHGNIFKKAIAYIKSLKKIKKYIKAKGLNALD